MSKKTKRIQNKNAYEKSSFKDILNGTKKKKKKKVVSSKIRKFANGFRIPDDMKDANTDNKPINKCPKCSSDIVRHPSLVSMPLSSSSSQDTDNMKKINIGDQDANFIFKFKSCKKCGYSEFYLHNGGSSRI
jgi:predicted Zn-ribbon and HTH transcriptional regulator